MYVTPPTNIEDLKQKVIREIRNVKLDPLLIRRAVKDMIPRTRIFLRECPGHMERLLENK